MSHSHLSVGFVLSPLSLHALSIGLQLLLSSVFSIKKQSLSDGEKAVAFPCDFSFTFVLFNLSFVLLDCQGQS